MEAAVRWECQHDNSGSGDASELKFSECIEQHYATRSPAQLTVWPVSMPYISSGPLVYALVMV